MQNEQPPSEPGAPLAEHELEHVAARLQAQSKPRLTDDEQRVILREWIAPDEPTISALAVRHGVAPSTIQRVIRRAAAARAVPSETEPRT